MTLADPLRESLLALVCLLLLAPSEGAASSRRGADGASAALGEPTVGRPGSPIHAEDLLRLRDIGAPALSPDGRTLAYAVREARPQANDYLIRWYWAPTDGSAPPTPVSIDGGQPIRPEAPGTGMPHGLIGQEAAAWSPDGTRFAFRRREADRIELWTVTPSTGQVDRVWSGETQVTAFAWTSDGILVFRTGRNPSALNLAIDEQAKHGWLMGGAAPLWAARAPKPPAPVCTEGAPVPGCDVRILAAPRTGGLRPATEIERKSLTPVSPPAPSGAAWKPGEVDLVGAPRADGAVVWTEALEPSGHAASVPLRRIAASGIGGARCAAPACASQFLRQAGWARDGRSVWFVKGLSSLGDEDRGPIDETALMEWRPGAGVRTVVRGDALLENCVGTAMLIYCRSSSAAQPARLVAIDLESGRTRVVADPNPGFASKAVPPIRKLTLVDPDGDRGFAYLVYPNNYVRGGTYPLVVVQYRAKGFLRGGIGDEIPIFPLAAEGYFVLSVDRAQDLRAWRSLDVLGVDRKERKGLAGPRKGVAAIEHTIDQLAAEGLVDPKRVAITGLSWGAIQVHYALQNSDRFAVAIASQGAADLSYFAALPDGPGRAHTMAMWGADTILPDVKGDLLAMAWSQRPQRLRAPLLLNLGQYEALYGFEGFSALRQAGRPLEVRVYPDEGHTKFHPRSFAGLYETNIMWLNFWLQGKIDARPEFAEQYSRWQGMRARLEAPPLQPAPGAAP